MKNWVLLCFYFISISNFSIAQSYVISGELKQWHKITIMFDGPTSSETATPNPFMDYRFDVLFTKGQHTLKVPGYFAADGQAAETSANSGNKWKVHFSPPDTGIWNFTVEFEEGVDIAINTVSGTPGLLDGVQGSFTVIPSDKTGKDLRARGRLAYVGEHYLRFLGDSTYFYKAGADAPENTLAYEDFDDVPNRGNRRKSWSPHLQDYNAAEASAFTWQNGKGTELLGVINYLSTIGVNAWSFLTFSLAGDDENVFPHLLKVPISTYNTYGDAQQWDDGVHHDRFDISRMDQWERCFEYADTKGIYLHFKTQETENDHKMDNGDVGRERKIYYRMLIARYGHHLALNWNAGEENTQTTQQEKDMAEYFKLIDPYNHNRVIHTYPSQRNRYDNLTGSQSEYLGNSIQTSNATYNELAGVVDEWVNKSRNAGKKWIVAVDEPGNASIGVDADPDDVKLVRSKVLWATLMKGGAGVEYYYGYQSGCGDLNCQDHRSREFKYIDASYAIHFFDSVLQPYLPVLTNDDAITAIADDYVLTNGSNMVCVYLPNGGSTPITLDQSTTWTVDWYNPRDGSYIDANTTITTSLTAPDANDWVALITTTCNPEGTPCDDGNSSTHLDTINAACICIGIPCPAQGTPCDDGDPTTFGDEEDGQCNCIGNPALAISGVLENEDYLTQYGTQIITSTDIDGGEALGYIDTGDSATYRLDIDTVGRYKITLRAASNTTGGEVIYVLGQRQDTIVVTNTGGWNSWQDFIVYDTFFTSGINDLHLHFEGSGAGYLYDLNYVKFELEGCLEGTTCDDNNPYTINDIWQSDCSCIGTPIVLVSPLIEAEAARVGAKWTSAADTLACDSTYLLPPNSISYNNAPSDTSDWLIFNIDVAFSGAYKIYARVRTTNGDDDSFWVKANSGSWVKWNKVNFPYGYAGYRWARVGEWTSGDYTTPVEFNLTAGPNTIYFAWREPGAQLDKIFVTRDDLDLLNVVQNDSILGEFSLYYTIQEACSKDTVIFDNSLQGDTLLVGPELTVFDKELNIINELGSPITIDGQGQYQWFEYSGRSLLIKDLDLINMSAPVNGGAFYNLGTIFLDGVNFKNNSEGQIDKAFTNEGSISITPASTSVIHE